MAIVITVANQKGGVGKTTTCVNVGAGLGMRGYKTLLIDFDPAHSLSMYFDLEKRGHNIEDWLTEKQNFNQVVSETAFKFLHVVSATEKSLKSIETSIQSDFSLAFSCLQKAVNRIRNLYDFILIDSLPSVTLLFGNSLVAADYILVPVELSSLSMKPLPVLLEKIADVNTNFKKVEVLGMFGTKYRHGVNDSDNCMAELKELAGKRHLKTHIRLNSKVAEAMDEHKPVQYFDKHCAGSVDYDNLVGEVLAKCQTMPATAHIL